MKKKIVCLAITITLSMIFSGCPSSSENNNKGGSSDNKVQVKTMDKKSVNAIMDNYLRKVVEGDKAGAKSFYSKELIGKVSDRLYSGSKNNPIVVGYKLEEGEENEEDEEKMDVKAHIFSQYMGKTYFSDDTFSYTLINEDKNIVIDKIKKESSAEIYEKDKSLYKREGDAVVGKPVISINDLPYYVVIGGDDSLEQKVSVPREEFGPCAMSSDGNNIIITTTAKGKGTLIGLIKEKAGEEEEQETINIAQGGNGSEGEDSGGEDSGGGSGEGQDKGQKSQEEQNEEKENITFKPVDIYLKEEVDLITFSPDGSKFAVLLKRPSGVNKIFIYKEEDGNIIKTMVDNQFGDEKFSLTSPYFISSDELLFTVTPTKNATEDEKKFKGQWLMDLKNSKVKQIR